jgi:hypothetical protein
MMGRQRKQFTLTDVQTLAGKLVVPEDSFYGRMATHGDKLVREEWFTELYSHRGRPSVSPVLLCKVLLLMFHDNVVDREAEERARFDLRWKAALNLGIDEGGFDATALTRFRARLVLHEKERLFFEETVKAAKEHGLISTELAEVIDSTPVLGAGAVQDTYNLLRSGVRKMLKVIRNRPEAQERLQGLLKRQDYDETGKPEIDWDDDKAREALLNEFVQDARTLLKETENLELGTAEKAAREMLAAVTEQDVDAQPDGTVTLKDGVAKDRVISTTDPGMRHGRKSSKGRFDGYKAHIMEDPASEIITAVAVTAANVPDAEPMPEMLDQQKDTGITVTEVTGDTAYGSGDTRAEMVGREVKLTAPVPPEAKRKFFPKSAFEVDLKARTCRCPAGHAVEMKGHHEPGQEGSFQFGDLCQECPLRALCTESKTGRTVGVHRHEELLQQGRAEQQTDAFKEAYRERPIVERKIAELVHHGMRQARYVGDAKILLQLSWTAATVNLKRLFKELAGTIAPKNRTEATSAT